jgi:Ca-activated chloride channel family protein
MRDTMSPDSERLLSEGIDYLRTARWDEAVTTFTRLLELHPGDPEFERTLDEAQLKAQIARVAMPQGQLPPRKHRFTPLAIGLTAFVFAAWLGVIFGSLLQHPQAAAAAEPVRAALTEPAAAVAPIPIAPVAERPDMLIVRMADGQEVNPGIPNIMIVLDASGSMLGKIGDERKIDIAHRSLEAMVGEIPDGARVALRTYGHRRTEDCTDLELVAPLTHLDRASLIQKIQGVVPVSHGRTPIAESLRVIGQDLVGITGETLVVVVSDGDETCGGDPVAAAADLRAAHPNVRVSVVGFDVGPEEWQGRLQGIAAQGGGDYFNAANAAQLVDALKQAVKLNYRVLDIKNREVFSGAVGTSIKSLPAGIYTVEIEGAHPLRLPRLRIAGNQTIIELRLQNEQLVGKVVRR